LKCQTPHIINVIANGRKTEPKLQGIAICSIAVKKHFNHRTFAVYN
jgi:hypothetical protein